MSPGLAEHFCRIFETTALVAYSRVHTGVHYPADVVAGALMGTTLAQITTHTLQRYTARRR